MSWDAEPPKKNELSIANIADADWMSEPPPTPSVTESSLRGAAQGATFGFADELEGGGRAAWDDVKTIFSGELPDSALSSYKKHRDSSRADYKKAKEANPFAYGAGELGGGIATALVPGIGAAGSIGKMALLGAAYGGAAGLGASEAENLKGQALDTGIGALTGGVMGAGAGALQKGGAKLATKAKGYLGPKLNDLAERMAFKSSGAMLKDFRAADERNTINKLGRFMLDKGIVQAGDKVDDVARKASEVNAGASTRLDDIYGDAMEKFGKSRMSAGFDPKRDKASLLAKARAELGDADGASSAMRKLETYLDEIAQKHGDAPMDEALTKYGKEVKSYLPKYRDYMRDKVAFKRAVGAAGDDPSQPVLLGMIDDLQTKSSRPTSVELFGKPADTMRASAPEPLQTQMRLPDLPTSESATARTFYNSTEPFWETVQKRGSHIGDAMLPDEQLGFLNANTAEQISMFGKQGAIEGLDLVPKSYASVNMPVMSQGKGQTAFALMPEAPKRPIRPVDIRNPMSPRRSNEIKGAMDDAINYARNPLSKEPAYETAMRAARRFVSDKTDESMNALGGDELVAGLKDANRDWGYSKQIADIAGDRVNRESANRFFGLTDTVAGGSGLMAGAVLAGGPLSPIAAATAVGSAMANKAARTYGPALVATTADKLAKQLMKSPQMQQMATSNPAAFKAMVYSIASKINASESAFPRAAEQPYEELDNEETSVPSWQNAPPEEARRRFLEGN